jgi:hypothetical protein
VVDWANESLDAARLAYKHPGTEAALRPGDHLDEAYAEVNLPVARERVARSGVRLAMILNEALTPRP